MAQLPGFVDVFAEVPVLLAHLAGLVVAIILLVRQEAERISAILALIGFALLSALDLANFVRQPLIGLLLQETATGIRFGPLFASTSVSCCCNIFDVAAVICLIVALWQAISSVTTQRAASTTASTSSGGSGKSR